jgi:arsenate reductase (thioredoxin)
MDYLGRVHMSFVITVCSNAEARCPIFPFSTQRLAWPYEDPAACVGTEAETLAKFREVRDQISERLQAWLKDQGLQPRPLPIPQSAA